MAERLYNGSSTKSGSSSKSGSTSLNSNESWGSSDSHTTSGSSSDSYSHSEGGSQSHTEGGSTSRSKGGSTSQSSSVGGNTSYGTGTSWASGQVQDRTQEKFNQATQDYVRSQKVDDAYANLQNAINNKPTFQSKFEDQLNNMYDKIMNREAFTYDFNKDAMYQMYKDQYQQQGKTVAFVAADTFRAGAIEQLAKWGERLNVPCIKGRENGDPSAAIVDGCRYAKENNIDILLCDTAGRLQNKANLMNELAKMNRVSAREIEGAPHNTWLVLDATTGQNGLSQAEVFAESTTLSGIILTKMDGTAKGGIVLAIKNKLHLPVYFIGLGEQPDDFRPFDLDGYLYSISEGLDTHE